jgi:ketosteroid isomerase-like protein
MRRGIEPEEPDLPRKDFRAVTQRLQEAATEIGGSSEAAKRAANVRAIQEQIDAIARGDLDAALREAHADLELEIFAPPEFPWVRHARGVDALRSAIQHNFGSVEQQTPTIQNVVTEHDTVVLFGREHGIIKQTGARYDVQFVQRFTFADGRLRSVRIVAARNDGSPA